MQRRSFLAASVALAAAPAAAQAIRLPAGMDPENTLVIELKDGPVIIRLRPDLAPKHVERIKQLTRQGFYNGIVFPPRHRGLHGPDRRPAGHRHGRLAAAEPAAEFSREPFVRGTLGMARAQSPNSANSQFFIMFAEGSFLNNQYTVFGNVVSGMENVDKIKRGNPAANGAVTQPDRMVRVRVAADIR